MKIPSWIFWLVLTFVGWKLFGEKLLNSAQDAAGPPESNPQGTSAPAGTPSPNLFSTLLQTAESIANSFSSIAQTSPRN